MEELNITFKLIEPEVQAFLDMPAGPKKNLLYKKQFRGMNTMFGNIARKEGKLYASATEYAVKRGASNAYYLRVVRRTGFTLNEKGKLSIWFGKRPQEILLITKMFDALKIDWVNQLPQNWPQFLTKTMLEKILNGKITNPIDFCTQYLKNIRAKASPRLMYKVLQQNMSSYSMSSQSPMFFSRAAPVSKNFDHYLQFMLDGRYSAQASDIEDMIEQAYILERKIDFTWSDKRIQEEHTNWTMDIMQLESDDLSDEPLEQLDWFIRNNHLITTPGVELITSERELYREGAVQHHCVFTNYASQVKDCNYVVYRIDYNGERATMGVRVNYDKLTIDQIRLKRNASPSEQLIGYAHAAIDPLIIHYQREGAEKRIELRHSYNLDLDVAI